MRKITLILNLIALHILIFSLSGHTFDIARKETASESVLQTSLTPLGQESDWNLVFSDEFNGSSLDTDKWTTCYWWNDNGCTIATNNELQWYQPGNLFLKDGVLKIRAQKKKIKVYKKKDRGYTIYNYSSGLITTGRDSSNKAKPVRFIFQYGYAEIRAKIPRGKGLWPAFWMLPEDHNSKPEIDVMEIYGDKPHLIKMTFHYIDHDGRRAKQKHTWAGPDFSADFHTFAVDWRPDAIIWYVDGNERWRFTATEHIPDKPMYVLINLAVGGSGPGSPNASTLFPSYYEIDYVRVWKRTPPSAYDERNS